jgi:hypothetical protein
MAWTFSNPLHSLTTDDQNDNAKKLWESESLGGITEDNNRLPQPVVGLLLLTIITAFMITFPLWGQRPHAAMYVEYIAMMNDPKVQAMNDDQAMQYIVDTVKAKNSEWAALQERHPVEMDDLRLIKPQIEELQRKGAHLDEYTVVGDKVVLANFEGNWRNQATGDRERKQPWWDKGYTIDIFFIVVFCVAVMIAVKRLPSYAYQPKHGHEH